MKKYFLCLIFIFGSSFAHADVEMELKCPDKRTADTSLFCKVHFTNRACSDATIKRVISIFMGNRDSTAGGMGIWGPFDRSWLKGTVIPASLCDGSEPNTSIKKVKIMDSLPASVAPTVGMAIVEVDFDYGAWTDDESADAKVQVLP